MINIEFVVLTCDAYLNTRVDTIRKTWGSGKNVKFLTDGKQQSLDLIGFDTPKDYSGIFEKYYNLFYSYDWSKYDYYFFTDDDTFIVHKNLNKLNLPPKDELFCVCRELCLNPDGTDRWGNQTGTNLKNISGENTFLPLYYPSGGSGFILSQSACISIQEYLKESKNIPRAWFGDLTIGFWMRNSNVKIKPNGNFWWDTHENLLTNKWEFYNSDNDVITFHYVNEHLMNEYNQKYN